MSNPTIVRYTEELSKTQDYENHPHTKIVRHVVTSTVTINNVEVATVFTKPEDDKDLLDTARVTNACDLWKAVYSRHPEAIEELDKVLDKVPLLEFTGDIMRTRLGLEEAA